MPLSPASLWIAVLVAVVAALVIAGLVLRYRALDRAGSPLPPGTGGARLVGVEAVVVAAHDPPATRGRVVVLGDEWSLADAVTEPLPVGARVRVAEVVGTRLVVSPIDTGPDRAGATPPTSGAPR